jgi:hypothetical protein
MQNLAVKTYPVETPELKVVEAPRRLWGTRVSSYPDGQSWEAFKEDFSVIYSCDGRWCGGRYVLWTLEADGPRGLQKKRGGYLDTQTGVVYYGRREV